MGDHAREDTSIDDEEVVGSVMTLVSRSTTAVHVVDTAIIETQLVGAHPVVGAAVGVRDNHLPGGFQY